MEAARWKCPSEYVFGLIEHRRGALVCSQNVAGVEGVKELFT